MKIHTHGITGQKAFIVVGIGAASGSFDALKEIVVHLKKESHIAYLIQLNLAQKEALLFKEMLELYSALPALYLHEKVPIAPNYIYLLSNNDPISGKEKEEQETKRPGFSPQNELFNSFFSELAQEYKERFVAVLLSGEDDDGTLGFRKVKKLKGITIVQHLATAVHQEMAAHALRAGAVDFVVTPSKLSHYICRIRDCVLQLKLSGKDSLVKIRTDNIFEQIYSELIEGRSPDFAFYNKWIIRSWVKRRLKACALGSEEAYLLYLQTNVQELALLRQFVQLPNTTFFRNPEVFTFLEQTVYSELISEKSSSFPLRVWIVGCGTGQEVYSFVISLYEFLKKEISSPNLSLQLFATDIDENAIAKAKTGSYSKDEVAGLSPSRLKKYFTEVEGVYTIRRTLRNFCTFAVHDFLKEPPFSKIDLISCRNLLSSMDPYWQKKAFSIFHHVLKENGLLILGLSESAFHGHKLFSPSYKTYNIFSQYN